MSKKKFTDGIDDIFSSTLVDQDSQEFVDKTSNSMQARRQASTHKTFVTNLDSLLSEISDDSFFSDTRSESKNNSGKSKASQETNGYRAPVTGLDALIRQTLTFVEGEDDETAKKRISVIVDKIKLERLKSIARMEGAFMKDIISQLIESYIHSYTKEKGVDI
jgi:hypothetical protein